MIDRDQPPSSEDEIRRAVFGQVDLQTAELEIVSSIYDGFAAAITVKGQPRTIALTREYGDAVQLMAMIERSRSAQPAASEAGAAAGEGPQPVRGEIRVIDGNRCRFIERELEGDKWEVIGPAAASDSETNEMAALRALPQAREDAQPVGWREVFIVDEEDGPVSGFCIDMADGSQIWTGECSNALLDGMGDERPDESGQFVMVATKGNPTRVVASVSNVDDGIEIARSLASRIAHPAPDALRVAVEKIRAEINAPLSGPTHGAWDRGRIAGLKEALTALQKGGV